MIFSYQTLRDFPRVKLSPVNLSDFSRAIESAYHSDLIHNRLTPENQLELLNCIIERFRSCDGYPGAKHPLELWAYRRQQLLSNQNEFNN